MMVLFGTVPRKEALCVRAFGSSNPLPYPVSPRPCPSRLRASPPRVNRARAMGDRGRTRLSAVASRSTAAAPDTGDMRSIAGELFDIAMRLNGAATTTDSAAHRGSNGGANPAGHPDLPARQQDSARAQDDKRAFKAGLAREIYAIRRQRASIFGDADLFGEPAWDILLDLYVAFAEDKKVSVSSACIGSASPPTTGLRWLGVLSEKGLIVREHDPADQRRVLVRLSDKGLAAMDAFLDGTTSRF